MSPKGLSLYAESNEDHEGVNIIGAAEILKSFKCYYSIHSSGRDTKSEYVGQFIDKQMGTSQYKKALVVLDNY